MCGSFSTGKAPVTARGGCREHGVAAVLRGYVLLQDIPSIIKTCRAPGPLYLSSLSDEELQLLDNMMNRLYKIAEVAAKVTVASHPIHLCMQVYYTCDTELLYHTAS